MGLRNQQCHQNNPSTTYLLCCSSQAEQKCPEYNGFNTRLCREAVMLPQPKTGAAILPLIDRPVLTIHRYDCN